MARCGSIAGPELTACALWRYLPVSVDEQPVLPDVATASCSDYKSSRDGHPTMSRRVYGL